MESNYPLLTAFAIATALVIPLPRLMERLRRPPVLGFILAGIVLGPAALGIIKQDGPVITLLAELGKLLFMFFVGFEIDLAQFKKNRNRAFSFGFLTFLIPLGLGIGLGRAFGYGWVPSLLIGSVISSHTLLAYPILQKLGVLGNTAVAATVSGTIFTDIAAMLVLAVAISIHQTGFSWAFLITEIVELAIFVLLILFGLSKIARKAIVRYGQTPELRCMIMIMLFVIAVASEGAQLINLEGIVGAFLAGIAIKRTLRGKFAVEQLEVVAHAIFIPSFFLATGFLVNFLIIKETVLGQPLLVIGFIAATLGGKYLAAYLAGRIHGYNKPEIMTLATLSTPQMAATLASAVVAYQAINANGERLLDLACVNAIVILVIFTCVLGPILTARYAAALAKLPQSATPGACGEAVSDG